MGKWGEKMKRFLAGILLNGAVRFGVALTLVFAYHNATAQVRAGYTTMVVEASGKCVDISGGDWSDGAAAIQYTCSGDNNQQFTMRAYNGSYSLVVKHSGKCLVALGGSANVGAPIVQAECTAYPAQAWKARQSGQSWQLVSAANGLCIGVASGSLADVATLVQTTCASNPAQLFQFPSGLLPVNEMTNVVARHSGQCLTVTQPPADRLPVIQSGCNGDALQQWRLMADNGHYKIGLGASGFCAAVDGPAAGAIIVLVDCRSSKATRWILRADNVGYVMSPRGTAMCLDVPGASVTEGTGVTQYSCIEGNSNQQWILAKPPASAGWSARISLPLVPAAVANLKNGKLLMWSAYGALQWEGSNSAPQTETAIFDPDTGVAVPRLVTETYHDMFCPGTSLLPDGRLLVNGGNGSGQTSIFDPDANSWTQGPPMIIQRGYPGNATLSNGDVLTLGGSWSGAAGDRNGEVWSEASGWSLRSGIPIAPFIGADPRGAFRGDNHLWLFAGADGSVFHAGPSPQMNRITTAGAGSVTSAGTRVDDMYSMNGNAVLYQPGKILKVGGAPAYEEAWANAAAYVIDFDGTSQQPRKISPMNYARAFHNSVVTPTGTVIVTGGQTFARPFSDERAILKPEQWDPLTEVFSVLPAMQTPRTYHSVSILLPDARVFVGGGGLCGIGCPANHPDAEILTPPYLLNASGGLASRPVLSMTDFETTVDGTFSVTSNSPIAYFSLIRLSSATHSLNNDQRFIKVRAQTSDARNYTLQMPSNAGTTIPGFYMLFGINTKGVPSVAQTVAIR